MEWGEKGRSRDEGTGVRGAIRLMSAGGLEPALGRGVGAEIQRQEGPEECPF